MNDRVIHGITRRVSLATIGGAALAATVVTSGVGKAKKNKPGNTCKKKIDDKCKKDAKACRNTLIGVCASSGDPACIVKLGPCCDKCTANGFLTCLILAQAP